MNSRSLLEVTGIKCLLGHLKRAHERHRRLFGKMLKIKMLFVARKARGDHALLPQGTHAVGEGSMQPISIFCGVRYRKRSAILCPMSTYIKQREYLDLDPICALEVHTYVTI